MKLFAKPFPDRCVVPGDAPNIGAMKVSNKERMIDLAIETLAEPWEAALNPALVARIAAEFQTGPLASRAAELAPYFAPAVRSGTLRTRPPAPRSLPSRHRRLAPFRIAGSSQFDPRRRQAASSSTP